MAQGYLGVQGSGCSHPAVHPSSRKEATRPAVPGLRRRGSRACSFREWSLLEAAPRGAPGALRPSSRWRASWGCSCEGLSRFLEQETGGGWPVASPTACYWSSMPISLGRLLFSQVSRVQTSANVYLLAGVTLALVIDGWSQFCFLKDKHRAESRLESEMKQI